MNFTWDKRKNDANLKKHGIAFQEALLVFADPFACSEQDRIVDGEVPWQTIGQIADVPLIVLIAHTWNDDETEHIRIISARPANKDEKTRYERNRYLQHGFE